VKKWMNKSIVGFCSASFFADWCQEMGISILPIFISQLSGPVQAPFVLGIVQGIADAGSTGMKLLSGWLADRVMFYKPFLIVGYGVAGIFFALIGFAKTVWLVLVCKVIAWLAKGIRQPMRDTWITKIVPSSSYGRVFGIQRAWDTLGALAGPLSAFILLKMQFPLTSIFLIAIIPAFFSVASIIFFTEEEGWQRDSAAKIHLVTQLGNMPKDFTFFLFVLCLFGLGSFNHALLIYRVQTLFGYEGSLIVATTSGVLLYAFFNAIRAVSELSIGALSDYVNRKYLLAIFGFGFFGVTCLGFMATTTHIFHWILFFGCAGVSAGTIKVLKKAHAAYIMPYDSRGVGLGLVEAIEGLGNLFSSTAVGFLWMHATPTAGLMYAAILSFISMVLLIFKK
jgi:MFS family permease